MTTPDKLPIQISLEQRQNPYIMSGLATRAFFLARYDMSPNNPIQRALENGFIVIYETDEV